MRAFNRSRIRMFHMLNGYFDICTSCLYVLVANMPEHETGRAVELNSGHNKNTMCFNL